MAQSDIYYCQKNGDQVAVVSSSAARNTRPTDDDNGTGIIPESVGTSISTDGRYSCSFTRPISVTKQANTITLGQGCPKPRIFREFPNN